MTVKWFGLFHVWTEYDQKKLKPIWFSYICNRSPIVNYNEMALNIFGLKIFLNCDHNSPDFFTGFASLHLRFIYSKKQLNFLDARKAKGKLNSWHQWQSFIFSPAVEFLDT